MQIGKKRVSPLKSEEDLNPNNCKIPRIETESMSHSDDVTIGDVMSEIKK